MPSKPLPTPDRLDDLLRGDVVEIPRCRSDVRVTQLSGDDVDRHAFRCEFHSVGAAESVGMAALFDSRPPEPRARSDLKCNLPRKYLTRRSR